MVERVQMNTEDTNPTLEEQAAAQDAAATKGEGGEKKEKILGKFDSYEDLEKSYTALEKKLGKGGDKDEKATQEAEGEPEEKPKEKPKAKSEGKPEESAEEKQAREVVENAGVNFDALRDSYEANGELTDDDYEALEKGGIPRHLVEEFIAGQEARTTLLEQQTFASVGGEETYRSMTAWAAENMSEEEIAVFNAEVNSGDTARIKFAVNGLKAQFDQAEGFEPSRQITGKASGGDNTSYASWAQVRADMSDPRYEKDPAFRAKVESKLARSKTLS